MATAGTDFNNTIGLSHGLFSSLAFRRVWQWANHGTFMHGSALFPRDRDIYHRRSAVFDQYKVRLVYVTP
ncbi:conserved hypothetical protein [Trichinella spiralis]|uniref:hypothetical protein n=1 Tax=Trichinella spiralis TaxID=6334 RepID=UPI0001EFE320|nr:conserved hypothetical protein [Trichinella spiralis]